MTKKKDKKPKGFIEFIDHGIFPGYTMLAYGVDHAGIIKELDNIGTEEAQKWAFAISGGEDEALINKGGWLGLMRECQHGPNEKPVKYFFIIVPSFDFSDYDYSKLAHEILHICQFFLPDVLNRDREIEAEAYFHTHLMRKSLELIR